jgi:iron complex outermembrane receptor protein
LGAFIQNTYKVNNWFSIESGLRLDKNTPAPSDNSSGVFVLPRINALFKLGNHFTSRIGGGLGYKMPSIFNDQTEQGGYQNIQALNISNSKAEQSYGLNGDLNYKATIGDDAVININQLFFYTRVDHPLILEDNAFVNAPGYLNSQGTETNIKLILDELGFYVGYTYTDARLHYNGQSNLQPLTPKNRINFDGTYEIEHHFRFGVESFYTGPQLLSDGTTGRGYITFGLLVQKMWKHLDIFINAENLTDQKQTRWGNIYTGSMASPSFTDIYAPLDGVVVNAGIRIKLLNKK